MKRTLFLLFICLIAGGGVQAEERDLTAPDFKFEFPKEAQLQSFFQKYEKDLRDEMNAEFNKAKSEGDIYNPWSLDANGRVTYKGKFWSVMISGYDYRGGAHGVPLLDVVYFDPETFETIPQSDLLADGAYDKLSRLSREGLVKQGFAADDEWMLEGTKPTPDNFPLVVPDKEGVEVIFNSYQVAPYAAGTPSVKLGWDVAGQLFKQAYRP